MAQIHAPIHAPAAGQPPAWRKDVTLKDGTSLRLRPISPEDDQRMLSLFDRLSPTTVYRRFMGFINRPSDREIQRYTHLDYDNEMALVGVVGDPEAEDREKIVAVGRYVRLPKPTHAEVAFTVEDAYQGLGIGTHLLEELLPFARMADIEVLEADVLAENTAMVQVFRDMGFEIASALREGVIHIEFTFSPTPLSDERRWAREQATHSQAVARLLRPRAVAVVGASPRPGTIGNGLVRNLLQTEFQGPVYPVNPNHAFVCSVPCYPTVLDVPAPIDLVVIAVPAAEVPQVMAQCAAKHVYAALVISAGFAETGEAGRALQDEVVEVAHRHGIRVVGPNSLGLLNTDEAVRLNATFAPGYPPRGRVAFSSQSGALGIAILDLARQRRIGLSQFVSVGNKADISGNDLLNYWGRDPDTDVVLMYMESFGNPRKFGRIARSVSRHKPIAVLKSGMSASGARAARSHTGALAASPVVTATLLDQAGIIATDSLENLFHAAKVLSSQPLPAGPRLAVLTNAGGPGILTADRADAEGLTVPALSDELQAALRGHLPATASVQNPVDMIASASAAQYGHCLRLLLDSDEVDQVAVLFIPPLVTEAIEVARVVRDTHSARAHGKPIAACLMGQDPSGEAAALLDDAGVASFRFPEDAVAALAHLNRYGGWRAREAGQRVRFDDVNAVAATALIAGVTGDDPERPSAWLPAQDGYRLLAQYGIPTLETRFATSPAEAAEIAAELGFPVAMKLASQTIAHKSDVHGVFLELRSPREVRGAYGELEEHLARAGLMEQMEGVLLQPMAAGGLETVMGVTLDPQFGPVLMFGLGGIYVELFQDVRFALIPATDREVDRMIDGLRSRRLFDGFRGEPARDLTAVREVLLRLSQLAEAHPEIQELDLNPVMAGPVGEGCFVADVRVRVQALDRFERYVLAHLDE